MQIVVIWHKFAMLIKKPLKTAEIDSELKQYIYVMWERGFLRKKVFMKTYNVIFKNILK